MAKSILTDNHLKAIGLVAAEWAYGEMWLESIIWHFAKIDNVTGYAITTHIGSETRINIIETLADTRLTNPTLKAELKAVIARVRDLRTERNNIIHSLWVSNRQTVTLADLLAKKRPRKPTPDSVRIKAKGSLKITNKPYTSKAIAATADKIGKLVNDMYNLLSKLREEDAKGGIGLAAASLK